MEPWFLREPARLRRERACVAELAQECDWLVGHVWSISEEGLCLDAIIRAHEFDYEVRVSFSAFFPDAPAMVRPRNASERWTLHQYGDVDGPLCLEWGPDNWNREITASDMLRSTCRLLEIENPLGVSRINSITIAPSRHKLTPGQELRTSRLRWLCSSNLESFLRDQNELAAGPFNFSFRSVGDGELILLVRDATTLSGLSWVDPLVPRVVPGVSFSNLLSGFWFKANVSSDLISRAGTLAQIRQLLPRGIDSVYLTTDGSSLVEGIDCELAGVIVGDNQENLHAFVVLDDAVVACARVESKPVNLARMPGSEILNGKRVGIVGLGSVGSKMASALCRMGVNDFYLVDHDVLLPENLARNALDWQGVARHKVDAARTALLLISAPVKVEVSRTHLTGQESNAAVWGVLAKLAECDVIVDATANPNVFNLLASVSRTAKRHLVWVEIFGGGIGGLVARSRVGLDPGPQLMRLAYLEYCERNPAPDSMAQARGYEVGEPENVVLTASDADVGILANHAASMVSDCLISGANSKYPYSIYLLGLAAGWVFRQPFEVIPIDTSALKKEETSEEGIADLLPEDCQFLSELLERARS